MKKFLIVLLVALAPAHAFADVSIHLDVEAPSGSLYTQLLTVTPCPLTTDPATTTVSAKCALEQAGLSPTWSSFGDDFFLTTAGGVSQDFGNNLFWNWWSDLTYGQSALNKHDLQDGERLLVALGVTPLKIELASATPLVGATTTATVSEFSFDSSFNPVWSPASSAIVHVGSATYTTDASGVAQIPVASADSVDVYAEKSGFVKSDRVSLTPSVPPVPASVTIRLDVETPAGTLYNDSVTVAPCTTPNNPSSTTNGFCAFNVAGLLVDATWFPFGALVNSVNGASDPNSFWLWFLNGDAAQVGIDSYLLRAGDTVLWTLGVQPLQVTVSTTTPTVGGAVTVTVKGFDTNAFGFVPVSGAALDGLGVATDANGIATITATSTSPVTFTVGATGFIRSPATTITASAAPTPDPVPSGGGSGGGVPSARSEFDVLLALGYLAAKQSGDGSFGSLFLSDWAAIALVSGGEENAALRSYVLAATPPFNTLTDYERHAMALEALGVNPYTGTGTDYIGYITRAFDGTQIGDAHLDNDDIFALIPLLHAGYSEDDTIIKKTTAFILSAQGADGSWDSSVDMTAAAAQALSEVDGLSGVSGAIAKAKEYLHAQQQSNGGFNNSFSTSWALQAIAALGDSSSAWTPSGRSGADYLASLQQSDGGVEVTSASDQNRIWATAYAIPGALGKTWSDILHSFSKPAVAGQAGSVLGVATSTPPVVATSTPAIASSTPAVILVPTLALAPKAVVAPPVRAKVEIASTPTTSPAVGENQLAAVGGASIGGFFRSLWDAIVGFFTRWL